MFNKTELTEKLTAELRELAKKEGINNADDLRKNDLIEQILQQQAAKSTSAEVVNENAAPIKETKLKANKENATEKPVAKRELVFLKTTRAINLNLNAKG